MTDNAWAYRHPFSSSEQQQHRTAATPNTKQFLPPGSIPKIINNATPHSETNHPPADWHQPHGRVHPDL